MAIAKEKEFETYIYKKEGEYIMLILTRRISESIVIGDDINITVLGIKGNQIRLGVEAPKEISVHREEIYNRIRAEKLPENEQQ